MDKYYVIREYDGFIKEPINKDVNDKYTKIPNKTFDFLEELLIKCNKDDEEATSLMQIRSPRGVGKAICGKNYVGIIELSDGAIIEILPKIYIKSAEKPIKEQQDDVRKIFLTMLKALKWLPFKEFNMSTVGTIKNNLFEIFIDMYVKEVYDLIKKGIKGDYLNYKGNENFLKGKIVFKDHIKNNFLHKERFYVSYDIFNINRPENKLIKATISKLLSKTRSEKNKKNLKKLLFFFDNVDKSINYKSDFSKIKLDRNMKSYELLLQWARIFLFDYTFTPFKGEEKATALLFPMEKVFEDYIAYLIRKQIQESSWSVKTQEKKYYLFNKPSNNFLIKPDIVLTLGKRTIVLDTKWKLLNPEYNNYGISQSDMYQMYAYGKKYNAEKVILIYPYNEHLKDVNSDLNYLSDDGVEVQVYFANLEKAEESIEKLVDKIIKKKN